MQTDQLLNELSTLITSSEVAAKLAPVLARVEKNLAANSNLPQAWEPLPIEVFGTGLPSSIKSCWVFILRGGGVFGAERHPNSHQRTFVLKGSAKFETFSGTLWLPHSLASSGKSLEEQAIFIPTNTWHRITIGPGNFVSVSFHTVPAKELIEETPVNNDLSVTQQRLYHE
ncbi:MAG: hypothetical protein L0Y80_07950 [Ignavibacteriae bacterium]|nr:hypothetical protein [Ignavibacteriota bacterium]